MTRKTARAKERVAVVGAGSLASFLAPALAQAGYTITEIIARGGPRSRARARALAAKIGARAMTVSTAALDAQLLWFCVPDRGIRTAAEAIAARAACFSSVRENRKSPRLENRETWGTRTRASGVRFAFHASGALLSGELDALRKAGMHVASVHPLMTFVPGGQPGLAGVPFALEGDIAATKLAGRIVADLGGESFLLPARRKAAYHAWATMTSPLLLAYLVTLEEAAAEAGLRRENARRLSLPIIRQTLENYRGLGPQHSFSGPFIRGDAHTVAKHLALLKKRPTTRAVYVALAQAALARLPVKNRKELRRLIEG